MRFALRKRHQRWVVCVGCTVLLEFDDFAEAFAVAWNAASVLDRAHMLASARHAADI